MGLKLLVNATEDFTGEFRKTANTQAQWKMNDSPSGDDTTLHNSSEYARNLPSMAGREQQHLPVPENLGNIFGSIP